MKTRALPLLLSILGFTGKADVCLSAQDLQLGLDWQQPRALDIQPPKGFLHLESAASTAPSLRFNQAVWSPSEGHALEVTGGLRWPSERQLSYRISAGQSSDVAARLRLGLQPALGALYLFEHPFGWSLEAGVGVEARRENLAMKDDALQSGSTLSRAWLRAILRHRFQADGFGPFLALEWALPFTHPATPSGVEYLDDLDALGASARPGTAALAHAPTYALTLALGFRFGRRAPAAILSTQAPSSELMLPLNEQARSEEPINHPALPPEPRPTVVLDLPRIILLDEAALHFALDSAELPAQGLALLKAWAQRIKALSHQPSLTVIGHTDATGPRPHNLRLSQARAEAVAQALSRESLTIWRRQGLGPDQPLAGNDTLEGRAKNRRVEIHLGGAGIDVKGRTASETALEKADPKTRFPASLHPPSRKPRQ